MSILLDVMAPERKFPQGVQVLLRSRSFRHRRIRSGHGTHCSNPRGPCYVTEKDTACLGISGLRWAVTQFAASLTLTEYCKANHTWILDTGILQMMM
jgi:hypothetical protein